MTEMLSPFDDEITSHSSTRLDIYQPLASAPAPTGGGGSPTAATNAAPIWLGNLATVTVRASDEAETPPKNDEKQTSGSLVLLLGLGVILLLAIRR